MTTCGNVVELWFTALAHWARATTDAAAGSCVPWSAHHERRGPHHVDAAQRFVRSRRIPCGRPGVAVRRAENRGGPPPCARPAALA